MSQRITIKLFEPIEHGSEVLTEIALRRLKGKEVFAFRNLDNLSAEEQRNLLSKLSGQPLTVIDQLDIQDIIAAAEVIRGFSQRGPETGEKPSP